MPPQEQPENEQIRFSDCVGLLDFHIWFSGCVRLLNFYIWFSARRVGNWLAHRFGLMGLVGK